jgi:5-methylcytosine-specific restriction endonuclease McrA
MKNYKEFPNYDPTHDLSKAPKVRNKRGMGAKPILEWEIRDVQKKARSAAEAARLLGTSYNTYKKWAKIYGVFEDLKNPSGIGIRKTNPNTGEFHKLDDILAGQHPNYPIWKLKRRLLLNGYMKEECCNCGYCERRITDHRVPLILDFLDGNRKNHSYENMRMLCFNCYFLIVGNITGPKKEYLY